MTEEAEKIIDYIVNEVIRRPGIHIDEDTPLVSSGLVDSFALVDILLAVEDITRIHIPAGKVRSKDMETVRIMLATAQRLGKPRSK